jgi:ribosomal protein S18 acetylase RimI-like enzyme
MPDPLRIRAFQPADEDAVIALWRVCDLVRPWNDPKKDIARKRRVNPEWLLVGEQDGRIVATTMVGYEGHRGWINYLAVEPALQRSGVGRAMMDEAERILRAAGCPKINLQVRRGNAAVIAFYERLGFKDDEVVSLGKRLEHD